jgi:hypothetical protein
MFNQVLIWSKFTQVIPKFWFDQCVAKFWQQVRLIGNRLGWVLVGR